MGKQFRSNLNETIKRKKAHASESKQSKESHLSDDATQDMESPSKEIENPYDTKTTEEKGGVYDDESQAFDFSEWSSEQKAISKGISSTDSVD